MRLGGYVLLSPLLNLSRNVCTNIHQWRNMPAQYLWIEFRCLFPKKIALVITPMRFRYILYLQMNWGSRQKYPSIRTHEINAPLFRNILFYISPCSLFSSCQMFLCLWDFCPPWATIGDSWESLAGWLFLVDSGWEKWNKFNLKTFEYPAWSGRNCWHYRASSRRKWHQI